jgi:tetratricopeptide (TPR) repeat protein
MLFLSHSGADSAAAKELARRLREAGLEVWLDLDHIQPGDAWMTALEEALQRASAFAVYVGSSGIQRWVDREVRVALERSTADPRFRIIPILGAGAAGPEALPSFLSQHQAVDLRREISPAELKRLVAAILARPAEAVSLLPPGTAPFRGLEYFDVEHAHLFFGRDQETQELLGRLRGDCFLAVVGASGSGKSSLVRAGLIPALHRGRFQNGASWPASWRIAICRPGNRPLRALASALPDLDPEMAPAERIRTISECARQLEQGQEGLDACIAALVPPGNHTLLLVDQFEEVFTLTSSPQERRAFIDSLLGIAGSAGDRPVHVLITLRADFYSRCWEHPELPARIAQNQHAARPLLRGQLREVIEKPLALAGASFEPGLVDRILEDARNEPGNLPLVEHSLLQLWERRQGRVLTHAAYDEIGGVSGALAHHAEEVFARLDEDGRQIAEKIFLRLTQLGEGTENTRRQAGRDEIGALGVDENVTEGVLARLAAADARLVITRREGENNVVEVAHEALIREWPRLREWIEANREAIRIERRLIHAEAEWVRQGKDPDALLRGVSLMETEEWARQNWEDLRPQEQEFLEESIGARDQAIREAKERRRRKWRQLQATAAVLGAAFVVATVATFYAFSANARAEGNFELARKAVDESLALVERDPHHYDLVGPDDPQVEALRRELLTRAQGFYREFIEQSPGNPGVREGLASAHFRLGHINRSLDDASEATVSEYREAIKRFGNLVNEQPANADYRQALANAHNWLGETLRQSSDGAAEAKAAYDSALALQQELHRSASAKADYRRDLARTYSNRGILQSRSAHVDAEAFALAEADFREAIGLLEPLAASGANPRSLQELGRAYNNLATLIAFDESRLEEAQEWYERAVRTHERLISETSANREYKLELVRFYNNISDVLRERGQFDRAIQRNRNAHDVIEELARPAPRLGIDRADAYNVRGRIMESQGVPAAVKEYRQSLALFQRLQTDPRAWSLPEFHVRFVDLLVNLAWLTRAHPNAADPRRLLADAMGSYLTIARGITESGTPADARNVLENFPRALSELSDRDRREFVGMYESMTPQLQDRAASGSRPESGSGS